MIRDGFKDEKKVTTKENRKKALMGERNYYATQATKLKDLARAISFTNKFSLILFGVTYALILFIFIFSFKTEQPYSAVKFAIWSSLYGALAVWCVLWKTVFKTKMIKKADGYTKELERLSRENLSKIGNAYKIYGKEYIEKLKKEEESKLNAQKEQANRRENSPEEPKTSENI